MSSIVPLHIAHGVAAAALAAVLPAQFVWPAVYAGAPGNAVMNAPFTAQPGHATNSTRCMVVLDASSLPFPTGTVLSQLSLRRDVGYGSQAYSGALGTLTVRIGPAVAAPDQIQDVRFSRLWGAAWTEAAVIPNFAIPAVPAPGSSLPPFSIVIPFTRTYTWTGGPLAIDMVFTPNSGFSQWRLDAFAQPRPQHGTSAPAGAGCVATNGFMPYHYALPETTMPGVPLVVQVEGGVLPSTPMASENFAVHVVGVQSLSAPLPLAVVGGPAGCILHVDPLLTFTVLVGNNSKLYARATNTIALPAQPSFIGALLYSQWLLPDTATNAALPLIASDALAITLGQVAPAPQARVARTVWKYGATGFDNESGRMVPDGYAPILRFN
jgi:hypothetical protein